MCNGEKERRSSGTERKIESETALHTASAAAKGEGNFTSVESLSVHAHVRCPEERARMR